jgi:hypothetical protein
LLSFLSNGDRFHTAIQAHIKFDMSTLASQLMVGFTTSADTGNEDLVIASRAALCDFMTSSKDNACLIGSALLHNLRTHQGNDRIIIPTLEIIAFLFHVGLFGSVDQTQLDLKALCLQTQKAGYKSGSMRKIEACVKVYAGIASMNQPAAAQEARKRLGALLLHPWPKVRSAVVDEIWGLMCETESEMTDGSYKGERLLSVDWAKADKAQIRGVVEALGLV